MERYTLSSDGKLTDGSVEEAVGRFQDEFPWINSGIIEAHLTMARTQAALSSALASRYAEIGISVPRFNILRLLYHSDDQRLTISDLGARLNVSAPNITRLVDALEAEGLVRRASDARDRRLTQVELSDRGREKVAELLPAIINVWYDIWTGLTRDETALLNHLLSKLRLGLLARYSGQEDITQQLY